MKCPHKQFKRLTMEMLNNLMFSVHMKRRMTVDLVIFILAYCVFIFI